MSSPSHGFAGQLSAPAAFKIIIGLMPAGGFRGRGEVIMFLPIQRGCEPGRPPEASLLNRTDRPGPMPGEADVKYLDGDFRVVRPGGFVRCAVTGAPIPLEELRYWSVDLQEAYATLEAVLQRQTGAYVRKA
jgi:hypothetical protein